MSIQVKQLSKQFAQFKALDQVSLEFPTGQLVALLGPSGCGKTTLLRIIAGLEQADEGEVWLEGTNATVLPTRERQIGFMFQHYALFQHLTVFENIAFGLRIKPRALRPNEAAIQQRVKELLELIQLPQLARRFPAQLSGGQRQRVALARALAVDPKVLLLDEPFGALDAQVRKDLRRWLRQLHEELHMSSIFVTHDQEEALEVADQIVLLNRGRVEQVGTPLDIFTRPATPFAYQFLGCINRFDGIWQQGRLHTSAGQVHLLQPKLPANLREGSAVIAFARPHELRVVPDVEHNPPLSGIRARISRILAFGPQARIELIGHAEPSHQTTTYYEATIPSHEVEQLQLSAGQAVKLLPLDLHLFTA